MARILVLGCDGQVGWELQRAMAPLGEVIALNRHGREGLCGDLSRPDDLAATVRRLEPQLVINAAAYTAVDKAESDSAVATAINAHAPTVLARELDRLGAWLIHYSTDYVFPGTGTQAWKEDDPTGPLSVYGQSKLAGEEGIRTHSARHLILRTSWVYASRGGNFARSMLNLALSRDQLKVVDDQIGAPTGADLIADVTAHIVRDLTLGRKPLDVAGTYHLAARGETSWCDYARFVLQHAELAGLSLKVSAGDIAGIPTEAYPVPAPRPRNSRLNTDKLCAGFGLSLPHWQSGVVRMLDEILPSFKA